MLKAIVFDFDGVILESVDIKTWAFKELFKCYPEHLDKIMKLHLDNVGISRFHKFRIIYQEILRRPIESEELGRLGEAFSRFVYKEILTCPFVPGSHEFLQRRAKQYRLFVASGTPQDELQDIIKHRGLDNFFLGVYGSPCAKVEILRGILMQNQFQPAEVVFIGDALTDYWAAHEACVPFIGRVPGGVASPFPEDGLIATIENLYQLDLGWDSVLERLSQQ